MTYEIRKLIHQVHDAADKLCDTVSAIEDEVLLLEEDDANLSPQQIEDLDDMLTQLTDMLNSQAQRRWNMLLKMLENHTEFYRRG